MGKKYNNGLPVGTGLRIDNPSPSDDRMYVETFDDLALLEYKYDGMVTRVQDENFKAYIYRENTNTWIPDATSSINDKFTSVGQVFVEDNEYTFTDNNGINYTWNSNGNAYANTETIITVPYAASGKKRIQIFYVDDSNGIKTRAGLEVNLEDQALSPELNPFEIQLGLIFVTDSTTGIPAPISTEDFVKRAHAEQVQVAVTDGLINASAATGGQTHFIITQPNVDIRGFVGAFTNADLDHNFYQGKIIIIDNRSGQPINLVHLSNASPFADARLSLPNAQNISVPHGGVVQFKYDEFSDSSCAMIAASFVINPLLLPLTNAVVNELKKITISVELIDSTNYTFYAFKNIKINSLEKIIGNGNVLILVNDIQYNFGSIINVGTKIEIQSDEPMFLNLIGNHE
jgi:hypothetical protein